MPNECVCNAAKTLSEKHKEVGGTATWIKDLYGEADKIVHDDNLTWEQKYKLIFSPECSRLVNEYLDYYDPDASYEEDVWAFMSAFDNFANHNNKY